MDLGKDLVAASATPLVLAILAEGDSYGYAIIKRVTELSGGHLQWTDGMLYPVLHRLERQGHVAARWRASDNGRRRKYYRITKEGRALLAAHRKQWQVVDDTLRGIWLRVRTA
jgi:PadR family transcriptional regulator, regulatory protein PadR